MADFYRDIYHDLYGELTESATATQALLLHGAGTGRRTVHASGSGGFDLTAVAAGRRTVHADGFALLTLTGRAAVVYRDICISADLAASSWLAQLEDGWAADVEESPWKAEVTAC